MGKHTCAIHVIVADTNADGASNFGEFNIVDYAKYGAADESTSKMRVETDDGATTYGATSATGKTVMPRSTGVKSITGIIYYSFGNYKLVPRTNNDIIQGTVSVDNDNSALTTACIQPHPANASSVLRYSIAMPAEYSISIFDIHGNPVTTLVADYHNVGEYSIALPSTLTSGLYQYRIASMMGMSTGTFTVVK